MPSWSCEVVLMRQVDLLFRSWLDAGAIWCSLPDRHFLFFHPFFFAFLTCLCIHPIPRRSRIVLALFSHCSMILSTRISDLVLALCRLYARILPCFYFSLSYAIRYLFALFTGFIPGLPPLNRRFPLYQFGLPIGIPGAQARVSAAFV